ncbi:MAG: ribonuclease E activity regulator RraA [Parvibaculum sp.]
MTQSPATTDLSDAHDGIVRHADPIFHDYGGRAAFHGPITTLRLFEDNALVRAAVEGPGAGRVLVVDGGGSKRCALFGGNLAQLAAKNGWAGVIVFGCVRDRDELEAEPVGVKALGHHPKKSVKQGQGAVDVAVTFAGITFAPGDWLYADRDGIITSPHALT